MAGVLIGLAACLFNYEGNTVQDTHLRKSLIFFCLCCLVIITNFTAIVCVCVVCVCVKLSCCLPSKMPYMFRWLERCVYKCVSV